MLGETGPKGCTIQWIKDPNERNKFGINSDEPPASHRTGETLSEGSTSRLSKLRQSPWSGTVPGEKREGQVSSCRSKLWELQHPPHIALDHKDIVNDTSTCPGWCGWVDWVPACEGKSHRFCSQSGHMPGFWARSLLGGAWEATTHWCFSPSLPLSKKK